MISADRGTRDSITRGERAQRTSPLLHELLLVGCISPLKLAVLPANPHQTESVPHPAVPTSPRPHVPNPIPSRPKRNKGRTTRPSRQQAHSLSYISDTFSLSSQLRGPALVLGH